MNHPDSVLSPHRLMERPAFYSIIFIFLGRNPHDIGVNVNETKKELTVLTRKKARLYRNGSFWTFGVPTDALLKNLSMKFSRGVLEIKIPRVVEIANV